jgi:hypothetical protein
MPLFTKKPVTVEARQYDGTEESARSIVKWANSESTDCIECIQNIYINMLWVFNMSYRVYPTDWIVIRDSKILHYTNNGFLSEYDLVNT